jgi:B-cell receptor-associated protein 31
MMRIAAEADAAKNSSTASVHNLQTETNLAARKFYAQRNTYLTGFTLFLSLVLTRTFYIVLDLIHAQEEYAKLKGSADAQKTIADLQAKVKTLEAQDRDFRKLAALLYAPPTDVFPRKPEEAGLPAGS